MGPESTTRRRAKVVERFYRGDASRGTPGVGLGLSLVQAVAKLHGSALELVDQAPGLRVVLTIPSQEPSAAAAAAESQQPASAALAATTLAPSP